MITVKTKHQEEPKREFLTMFKQYASIPDNSRDALLVTLLKRAIKAVEEVADKSILTATIEAVYTDLEPGEVVRLYYTPGKILSVKNVQGEAVDCRLEGKFISSSSSSLVVEYETEEDKAEASTLLAVVYQYATALYDGEDSVVLSKILSQC